MNRPRPLTRRLSTVLPLLILGLLGFAPLAFAHDELVSSSPASGAPLTSSPAEVSLTFAEPPENGPTTVTVTGPEGTHWEAGPAVVEGTKVTAPVRQLGPAGQYTIDYRVLSDDGHPVSGSITFSFSPPSQETSATPQPTQVAPAPAAADVPARDSGGTPVWPWIVGAAVVIAAGVAAAVRLARNIRK